MCLSNSQSGVQEQNCKLERETVIILMKRQSTSLAHFRKRKTGGKKLVCMAVIWFRKLMPLPLPPSCKGKVLWLSDLVWILKSWPNGFEIHSKHIFYSFLLHRSTDCHHLTGPVTWPTVKKHWATGELVSSTDCNYILKLKMKIPIFCFFLWNIKPNNSTNSSSTTLISYLFCRPI